MISHRHKCLFVHIPKTAGKSVLHAFGLPLLGRDYDGGLEGISDPYGHRPVIDYRREPWFRPYFKFAIVRHPLDRLVSAFAFLDGGGLNHFDREFAEMHLKRFDGDFRRFVREGLKDVVDHVHFRPQRDWICDRWGRTRVDFVGRFETLDESWREIRSRLKAPVEDLGRLNASARGSWRDYFDMETLSVAATLYAQDFRKLGYASPV